MSQRLSELRALLLASDHQVHMVGENELFNRQIEDAVRRYPSLRKERKNETTILAGSLVLVDQVGAQLDTYEVEIHPHVNYPRSFPYVFEVGGRIPKNIDWHVYPVLEWCCLCVPAEEVLACKTGLDLTQFISAFVIPFFFGQTFRREHGYFYQERSHGAKGILEYYQEKLLIKDVPTVLSTMLMMIRNEEPARPNKCFCGSNRKYRHCHKELYRAVREIGPERLMADLDQLLEVPRERLLSWSN